MKKLMFVVAFAIASVVSVNVKAETPKPADKEYSFIAQVNLNAPVVTVIPSWDEVESYLYENADPLTVNDLQGKPGTVNDRLARLVFPGNVSRWVTVHCSATEIISWNYN